MITHMLATPASAGGSVEYFMYFVLQNMPDTKDKEPRAAARDDAVQSIAAR